jgi:prepilin peptidase CpaA
MALNPDFHAFLELLSMLLADPRSGMLIALLIAAAWSDFGTGRIPNALVFGGIFLGLAYNGMAPPFHVPALESFLMAAAGMACGLALMLPFYLLRAMGAGDVKLMAMSGAFLGFPDAVWAVLGSFVAGGLLSLAYLAAKGELRRALVNISVLGITASAGCAPTLDARSSAGTVPYGIAIAAGTIGFMVLRQLGFIH